MAHIAAHLNAACGDSVALGIVSLYPHPLDLGPRQYPIGDTSALNQYNQPTSQPTKINGNDDDFFFNVALFSALEQTHCARWFELSVWLQT